jgi:sugar (pentulose or hexulose) kinase
MVVLEGPLGQQHHELDLVTTPAGDPVAMVHCNNGASELGAWVGLFEQFAAAAGMQLSADDVFGTLFAESLEGAPDAGGLLAYNQLSGEPIAGLEEGRPLVVRTPESRFTLANFMRSQLYGVFATLALGMRVLTDEGVTLDQMFAHGGLFRTAGVAQRYLAAAIGAPVSLADTASEGGAWGVAVLASFTAASSSADTGTGDALDLDGYLRERVFSGAEFVTAEPDAADVEGFASYLDRYSAGLAIEQAAVSALA